MNIIIPILIGILIVGALYTSISLVMRATAAIAERKSMGFHAHTLIVAILWALIYILLN